VDIAGIGRRVKRRFGDTSGAQITDADLYDWINDALIDIARRIEYDTSSISMNVTDGTETYYVGNIYIISIALDGRMLRQTTFREMDQRFPNRYETVIKGTPEMYWMRSGFAYLYPIPDAASAGNSRLVATYIQVPNTVNSTADISTDTNYPDLPTQMHEAIVEYCIWKAKELNEDADADKFKRNYDEKIELAMYESHVPYANSYPAIRVLPGDEGDY
jgi:hypothetical protein